MTQSGSVWLSLTQLLDPLGGRSDWFAVRRPALEPPEPPSAQRMDPGPWTQTASSIVRSCFAAKQERTDDGATRFGAGPGDILEAQCRADVRHRAYMQYTTRRWIVKHFF